MSDLHLMEPAADAPFADLKDDYWTLDEGYFAGCWIADVRNCNIEDLVSARPGAIIRVTSPDAVQYIPPSMDDYERVAGLISDAA